MLLKQKHNRLALLVVLLLLLTPSHCNQEDALPGTLPTGNTDSPARIERDGNNERIIFGGYYTDGGDEGLEYYDESESRPSC